VSDFITRTVSFSEAGWHNAQGIEGWFKRNCQRSAEAVNQLELVALKRVLRTSEDSNALVYAAINGQAISDKQLLRQILDDDECNLRIHALLKPFSWFASPDQWQILQAKAMASFFVYLVFSSGSIEDFISPITSHRAVYIGPEGVPVISETDNLYQDIQFLSNALDQKLEDNFACPYHVMTQNCMAILMRILLPNPVSLQKAFQPTPAESLIDHYDLGTQNRFWPVEHTWFVASAIKQAKALDDIESNENDTDPETYCSQRLEISRGVLAAYQKHLEMYGL
ncbi:hypothetical protein FS837_003881, partial [Tulasnella sp. UAMH 9824]